MITKQLWFEDSSSHGKKYFSKGDHVLSQFTKSNASKIFHIRDLPASHYIKDDILKKLSKVDLLSKKSIWELREDEDKQVLNHIFGHDKASELRAFSWKIPVFEITYETLPLTSSILNVKVEVKLSFKWDKHFHGESQQYLVCLSKFGKINTHEIIMFHNKEPITCNFMIAVSPDDIKKFGLPEFITLNIWNMNFYGTYYSEFLALSRLEMPTEDSPNTKLLDLEPVPIASMQNEKYKQLYKHETMNPVQSQVFYTAYFTDTNMLVGSPTGSGKTYIAEMAMLRLFEKYPTQKIIYIAPLKALSRERLMDWSDRLTRVLGKKVLELTGDFTPDIDALRSADILITTPEKWDGISRHWHHRSYVQSVGLVLIDEVHLLGLERGPVLEVIVSRMRYIGHAMNCKVRFVCLSTALSCAYDVAQWLGVPKQGLFNFGMEARPVQVRVTTKGFKEKAYCPRMAAMNKPLYQKIIQESQDKPVLIFVSSRRQTRLTGQDLVKISLKEQTNSYQLSSGSKGFLKCDHAEIEQYVMKCQDEDVKELLYSGVGIHHAGLQEKDRKICEELFMARKIQVLIATSTLAWGINLPAYMVIIKGTEYYHPKNKRYVDMPMTDILQMVGRAGRPQFEKSAKAVIYTTLDKESFIKRFLYERFPVESSLLKQLSIHFNAEIQSGSLTHFNHCYEYLTWTYFYRRILKNPNYYGLWDDNVEKLKEFLTKVIERSLLELEGCRCLTYDKDTGNIVSKPLGFISSMYYINHSTVKKFYVAFSEDNMNYEDLLKLLTEIEEFSEIPVRHNEEKVNFELCEYLPWKVPATLCDDPHAKTFILLQAHMTKLKMQTDYMTDLSSVLYRCIPVLQAMLDTCVLSNNLAIALKLVRISQKLMQGCWVNSLGFEMFDFLLKYNDYDKMVRYFYENGIYEVHNLLNLREDQINILLEHWFDFDHMGVQMTKEYEHFLYVLKNLPRINDRSELLWYHSTETDDRQAVPIDYDELHLYKPHEVDAKVNIRFNRINMHAPNELVTHRYPKNKQVSYVVIIGVPEFNLILACKRINIKKNINAWLNLNWDEEMAATFTGFKRD